MKGPLVTIREFVRNLGPVEQAQIVASTAVVVTMTTIVAALAVTGQQPRLMDFISILAAGTIGFTSVYFSLHYSRQLDEQRQQLLALNTIAEAVNRVVELRVVLQTALDKITEMLPATTGWIYMLEGDRLVLKSSKGSSIDFLSFHESAMRTPSLWLHQPRVEREQLSETGGRIPVALKDLGVQFWTSIPLRTMDGIAGALIVAGRDYTMFTPKQAELMEAFGNQISVALNNALLFERLRESERQYADLFEHAPDIYVSVDRDHRIVGCNKTGADTLGLPKDSILGRPLEELFVTERRDTLHAVISDMFEHGHALKGLEELMIRTNERPLNVMLNSTLVFDEKGRTVTARVVARDITERKMMEGAILHAQKIDSIGNLAGGIAHDFNNLLAAILGSASVMRRKITSRSKLHKYVEIIDSSARRGSSLTRQLLTFARKTETMAEPVHINAVIEETLEILQRSVSKEIDILTSLTPESVMVHGDSGQIQQAILNLCLNARDAMPHGGTLTISTDVTTADAHTTSQYSSVRAGPFVAIRVEDTGLGIPAEIQNRIFEPFFTTKDHGTGLGLSVVYGVIQNHGGFINLESTPGQGTTFTLYLPRTHSAPAMKRRLRRQRLPRGSEHVLIIDDELSVCEVARDMLTDLGYTVHVMHNGKKGVEYYRSRMAAIDLILLDINMPVMGGKEAFELLRTINPGALIILITGYGKDAVEPSKFSTGVNGFMQKPFQLELLALKVRQVLDDRAIYQESPNSHGITLSGTQEGA
jgi:two-component system, cell cycle sensor histidine kinase and response regulator CckA